MRRPALAALAVSRSGVPRHPAPFVAAGGGG